MWKTFMDLFINPNFCHIKYKFTSACFVLNPRFEHPSIHWFHAIPQIRVKNVMYLLLIGEACYYLRILVLKIPK